MACSGTSQWRIIVNKHATREAECALLARECHVPSEAERSLLSKSITVGLMMQRLYARQGEGWKEKLKASESGRLKRSPKAGSLSNREGW